MNRTVHVGTQPAYDVRIGTGLLEGVGEIAGRYSRVALLTDENVGPLYLERLPVSVRENVIRLPAGEDSKSFTTLERVLDELCVLNLDRSSLLVALGGGVLGDLTGLAASLYKRGIDFVQCATTLLAQVDASVGGKTAVNLPSGKNMAGTFHQPVAVFADVSTLGTLPRSEFASGLGEVLKTALLDGEEALAKLERDAEALVARDLELLAECVQRCVEFKAAVVAEDPSEKGRRKCLNLGHTYAHAIEHIAGFGVVPHGVAVAVGIALALEEAARLGTLTDATLAGRVGELAARLGLATTLAELESGYGVRFEREAMLRSMRTDKKNSGGEILLVLPVGVGEVALDVPLR